MASLTKILMLLSLVVSFMCMMSNAASDRPVKHVNIINKIGKDFIMRCQSKDDDLGERVLHNEETFSFSFRTAVFKRTLFFCRFTWDGQLHWFDIYDAGRDGCNDCTWSILPNGPCLAATRLNHAICYQYH
ncbi:hypothetical protein CICLE_v10006730mg [Citrus x clementina]|uniref:S-protein homolog n=1 Tax=Citrus clementina TaxID=85681 RepID=V4RIF4_CITCL|nr:hypothetical protein CICLE_v10006730mg [Citrus x clementina]